MRNWTESLPRRIGQSVFDAALQDARSGKLAASGTSLILARGLSVLVLVTPVLVVLMAAGLVALVGPSPLPLTFAAILVAVAWYLRPRSARPVRGLQHRQDLPATFALLDALTAAMQALEVDAIEISNDFNASVRMVRGERILGIGTLLWESLDPPERLAVLAHEVGHLISGDPNRAGPIWRAQGMLGRWHCLTVPTRHESLGAVVLLTPVSLLIELTQEVLGRLAFLASQRAEYRADALAAGQAGIAAMVRALQVLSQAALISRRINSLHMDVSPDGRALIDRIVEGLRQAPEAMRASLLQQMEAERWTIDRTHPPTVFRIGFLRDLAVAETQAFDQAPFLAALEHEWVGLLEAHGRVLHGRLARQ